MLKEDSSEVKRKDLITFSEPSVLTATYLLDIFTSICNHAGSTIAFSICTFVADKSHKFQKKKTNVNKT